MDIAEHIAALREHGGLLADAAERAGLEASVSPCAPWRVKDLLRHTGYIHRWAASHITERPASVLDGPSEAEILSGGAPDDELIGWFRQGHAALVETLSTADPGLQTATFMRAPSPLAFWARRQAHETAIHRADAESAAGLMPEYAPGFAADGIDELIMGFAARRRYRLTDSGGVERSLTVRPHDAEGRWHVRLTGDGTAVSRDDPVAECTLEGPAAGLYAFLWNRSDAARAGLAISGTREILGRWNTCVRVEW